MGLLTKASDKMFGTNTILMPYEKMAEMVKKEFIEGANAQDLKDLIKAVKGGKAITSVKGTYKLSATLGTYNISSIMSIIMPRKDVYIEEIGTNNIYQLDKDRNWKKFYNVVKEYIG